ncbi:SDR family oxidoreductase [Pengzhenrongella sp.]|uniref:SDR family NAD(P)-dependent oxidoreductase n=1 Tax=Pengzhenrongella sp. TaxID=2888820 RepID=UPI002F92D76D
MTAPAADRDRAGAPLAVVTGASSGIGLAVVQRLLADGWRVLGASRRRPAVDHPDFTWRRTDLASPADVGALLDAVPALDAVVHAAGVLRAAPLGALSAEVGEQLWRLHVQAPTQLVNGLVGRLRDGGRIALIGSRTSSGAAGKSQYAASKAALVGLARSWAMELAPRGITVNVVAPGPTDTPMLVDPERAHLPARTPPLGRFVQPGEVAGLVAYLLGPDGGSLTGQQLVVCGGASL